MFKSPSELQEFIVWAKEQKIKRVKVDNIEFEISDLALIEGIEPLVSQTPTSASSAPEQEAAKKEEDDLLYWSTGN